MTTPAVTATSTPRIVIAGMGIAGLAAALAFAGQGRQVTIVDRDDVAPPADVARADDWVRRGVPQFRQPHALLARLRLELQDHLPAVEHALLAAGALDVEMPGGLRSFWCRRSTLEWVLRTMVGAEPLIAIRHDAVRDVRLAGDRVSGVVLGDGSVLDAHLVVDATGRRGQLSRNWMIETIDEPADEVYTSRRYRINPGQEFDRVNRGVIGVTEADGFASLIFPHDAGTFTATFTRLPDDDELSELREVPAFEAAARLVPMTAAWTADEHATPVSDIMVMAGLRNTFRTLDPQAPLGLHPLADAICTTNPHFGRGSSLAVAHAVRLAAAVADDPSDARTWREKDTAWVQGELSEWSADGRNLDRARAAMWRGVRSGQGRPGGPPAGGPGGPGGGVPLPFIMAAAGVDREVGQAVMRHMHLLGSPKDVLAVAPKVGALMGAGWRPGLPAPGHAPTPASALPSPSRADLVAALASQRSLVG